MPRLTGWARRATVLVAVLVVSSVRASSAEGVRREAWEDPNDGFPQGKDTCSRRTRILQKRLKKRLRDLDELERVLQERAAASDGDAPPRPQETSREHGAGSPEAAAGDLRRRQNVLLILADDLRPQMSAYGHEEVPTPNLDRLAARSMLFTRAYAQAPSCNPSRNSLLTGRRPDSNHIYFFEGSAYHTIGGDATTMPRFFRWHGYDAYGTGKVFHWEPWHDSFSPQNNPYYPRRYNQEWGCEPDGSPEKDDDPLFAHLPGCQSPRRREQCVGRGEMCDTFNSYDDDLPEEFFFDHRAATKGVQLLQKARAAQLSAEGAPKAEANADPARPFFLAVGFHSPHVMWHYPSDLWNGTYAQAEDFPLPAHRMPPRHSPPLAIGHDIPAMLHTIDGRSVPRDRWMFRRGMPDLDGAGFSSALRDSMRDARRFYAAAVTFMDRQVGRLLDELDALGLADSTVVAFTSDHGFSLGEGARWGKYSLFESDARVPLIVHDPRAPAHTRGTRADAIVELVDLLPTLADLAGIPMPSWNGARPGAAYAWMDGQSFGAVVRGQRRAVKAAAFTVQPRCVDRVIHDTEEVGLHTCLGRSDEWHLRTNGALGPGGPLMGVSVRMDGYRYTAWYHWSHETDNIDPKRAPYAEELYLHPEDNDPALRRFVFDLENVNVINDEAHDAALGLLRGQVLRHFSHPAREGRLGTNMARVDATGQVPEARTGPLGGRPGLWEELSQERGW